MQLRDLFEDFSIPAASVPGAPGVAPLALEKLLREPLDVAVDWKRAERLLLEAREQLPERLEIQIALYKMYAYTNLFDESLLLINSVLKLAATQAGFHPDWSRLHEDSAPWYPATGAVRFYLYTLKATGFVLLRKGDIDGALRVLRKLRELDPLDQVGGSVVMAMAERLAGLDD
jgi:tetratricopeptide (TPR) repeat protein